ncbi:hypothetical protein VKT23_017721 [Stygiomarasmius scandens]|uniref:Axial budding pattern protein 2 n=1 Tax=Marasmiellus scandens TaxID=2682957 RepID=A0ABR1IUI3_9AGAR
MSDKTATLVIDDTFLSNLFKHAENNSWGGEPSNELNPTFRKSYSWTKPNSNAESAILSLRVPFDHLNLEKGLLTVYGYTPPLGYNQTFFEFTDDENSINSQSFSSPPNVGSLLLTVNASTSADINKTVIPPDITVIDYVTILVSDNYTDLRGTTILVDDTSPEIHFEGNWSSNRDEQMEVTLHTSPNVTVNRQWWPHGNSTHSSQAAVGDSFTFRFKGTSVNVVGSYPGILDNGLQFPIDFFLALEFTLDSNTTRRDINGPGGGSPAHFEYMRFDSLDPNENHTLTMSVTEMHIDGSTSSPFMIRLDYLIYTPSFTNLFEKPDFSGEFSKSGTYSSTSAPTSSSTAAAPNGNDVDSSTRIGAIAGGIIGSIILVTLVVLTAWLCRRKHRSLNSSQSITQPGVLTPFTLQSPIQSNTYSNKSAIISASQTTTARRHSFNGFSSTSPDPEITSDFPANRSPSAAENGYRDLMAMIDMLTVAFRGYSGPPEYQSEAEQ